MLINECYEIGHISKTSGYKGAVILVLDVDNPVKYKKTESVFIEINDKLIPFLVKSIHLPANSKFATIHLENIDSNEQAQVLLHHKVHLPLALLPPLKNNQFYYHEIIGFEVVDEVHGNIGKVTGIIDMTHYPIIQVDANGKEVLIPAIKDIIKKINRENNILNINAPDGLIELYTQ
jgi:16S rRNA processing protein RimM